MPTVKARRRAKPKAVQRGKAPTNLSLRRDLVERARALDLNLSQLVEGALERAILEAERAAWLEDNAEAIDEYNAFVARHGVFGEAWRPF